MIIPWSRVSSSSPVLVLELVGNNLPKNCYITVIIILEQDYKINKLLKKSKKFKNACLDQGI